MTLKFKVVLLALLLSVGLASCGGQEHGAANQAPANKEATPPAKPADKPAPAPEKDAKDAPAPAAPAPAPAPGGK